jgi:hypothetical protein
MTTNFDIFSLLDHKRGDDSDTEFSFRAVVTKDFTLPNGDTVQIQATFPPTQLKTVENKSDFNRLLNGHLADLRSKNVRVHKVVVTQNSKPVFDFVP